MDCVYQNPPGGLLLMNDLQKSYCCMKSWMAESSSLFDCCAVENYYITDIWNSFTIRVFLFSGANFREHGTTACRAAGSQLGPKHRC